MSFTREKIKDFYLLATDVENIFINEYMPAAPGDFVKVYLYGLLYSQNGGEMSRKQMSRQLSMSERRIDEAWEYWSSIGVVDRKPADRVPGDWDIEFKQLRSLMYGSGGGRGNSQEEAAEPVENGVFRRENDDGPLCSGELKDLLSTMEKLRGGSLSPSEIKEIFSLTEEDGAAAEVVVCAAEYCFEKGKTGIRYIAKVAREWTKDGLRTREDVAQRLSAIDERLSIYKRILGTLGLNRGATKAEKELVDSWIDEMGFNMDKILEACERASFIASPNLRYVNKVLHNWYEEAKINGRGVNSRTAVTQAELNRYYEHLRAKAEEEAQRRREEIYRKLPRVEEVDKELLGLGKKLSKTVLGGSQSELKEIKRLMELLEEERAVILTENNYREDYTDIKYACDKCGDTGITEDGGRCSCVKERMGEAELWQNLTSSRK